ncbi:Dolichyl-phosphate-mannose-protein mannosyltransferase [uncultured archaeon]|nr:Dolichyl-phosphate-mannose-protein mannosyltransferase [uncultured archaeon]
MNKTLKKGITLLLSAAAVASFALILYGYFSEPSVSLSSWKYSYCFVSSPPLILSPQEKSVVVQGKFDVDGDVRLLPLNFTVDDCMRRVLVDGKIRFERKECRGCADCRSTIINITKVSRGRHTIEIDGENFVGAFNVDVRPLQINGTPTPEFSDWIYYYPQGNATCGGEKQSRQMQDATPINSKLRLSPTEKQALILVNLTVDNDVPELPINLAADDCLSAVLLDGKIQYKNNECRGCGSCGGTVINMQNVSKGSHILEIRAENIAKGFDVTIKTYIGPKPYTFILLLSIILLSALELSKISKAFGGRSDTAYVVLLIIYVTLLKVVAVEYISYLMSESRLSMPGVSAITQDLGVPASAVPLLVKFATTWDGAHYLKIALHGYETDPGFAPLYSWIVSGAMNVIHNPFISSFIVSNLFSYLAIIAFYFTASRHLTPTESTWAAAILASFPTFIAYGTVGYSESTYLFFAILSWNLIERRLYLTSGVFAAFALLTRYLGGILVPIHLIAIIVDKKMRPHNKHEWAALLMGLALPVLALAGLMFYVSLSSGSYTTIFEVRKGWDPTLFEGPHWQVYRFLEGDNNVMFENYMYAFPFLIVAFSLLPVSLALSAYCFMISLLLLSLAGQSAAGQFRYLLMAWPVFLALGRIRDPWVKAAMILAFIMLGLRALLFHLI